jgi:hypothetical protein
MNLLTLSDRKPTNAPLRNPNSVLNLRPKITPGAKGQPQTLYQSPERSPTFRRLLRTLALNR